MAWTFDYLVVGAGFSGLVLAERISRVLNKSVLVVEKRDHIGGNAQDEYDQAGVLIHKYGPHYFRTNSQRILDYLSKFTEWHPVAYEIKSYTKGRYWSFPVNLNTFEEIIGRKADSSEFASWLEEKKLDIPNPSNSEEIITSQIGLELYKLFFEGYTLKQWNKHPRDLDPSVCGRIPIRTNRDNRYLKEEFQALPKHGYHTLFSNMVTAMGDRVKILLKTDYREVLPHLKFNHMIYTGPIDSYFNYSHGRLPYRSLRFEAESFEKKSLESRIEVSGKEGFWQPAVQVNYPNEMDYTRIVEIKHATGQRCENSTIVREYPDTYEEGKEPFYPIPNAESAELYKKYKALAEDETGVSFVGRLATYRYYNMDQVVGQALKEFEKLPGSSTT